MKVVPIAHPGRQKRRYIAKEWKKYAAVMPPETDYETAQMFKVAFYSGASSLLSAMLEAHATHNEYGLADLEDELAEFCGENAC